MDEGNGEILARHEQVESGQETNLTSVAGRLIMIRVIQQRRIVLALACGVCGLLWATQILADAPVELPHILIVMADDMGYGDPQCYNPESRITTPNIDSLARDGMRFVDAHAPAPLCHTSRYGLMTGRYPFRADVRRWSQHAVIESGQTTIASLLKARGYHTVMVGKWHLGFEEVGYDQPWRGGPMDVGFDAFFGIRASTDIPPYFYIRNRNVVAAPTVSIAANRSDGWSPIQGEFWRAGQIAPDMKLADVLPKFTDEAVSSIREYATTRREHDGREPLMLYLAFAAPHTPWLPSERFAHRSKVGMYGDYVEMVDAMIGRVLAALDAADMRDNTLVIFTSDNGPVWYESDVERFGHDSAGGLRGMKGDAWEAGHRMPFIVRWPGEVAVGSVNDQLICFTDVLATLAAIVGYPLADSDGPDSIDFSTSLLSESATPAAGRRSLVMRSAAGLMTVRQGNWKLIDGLGSGGFSHPAKIVSASDQPAGQLYDLSNDLGETVNQYNKHPEIVRRLTKILASVNGFENSR
jgi:arylsulfatase A